MYRLLLFTAAAGCRRWLFCCHFSRKKCAVALFLGEQVLPTASHDLIMPDPDANSINNK